MSLHDQYKKYYNEHQQFIQSVPYFRHLANFVHYMYIKIFVVYKHIISYDADSRSSHCSSLVWLTVTKPLTFSCFLES